MRECINCLRNMVLKNTVIKPMKKLLEKIEKDGGKRIDHGTRGQDPRSLPRFLF